MKVHSDKLTRQDFRAAIATPGVSAGVVLDVLEPVGSRKRRQGWLVKLCSLEGGAGTSHPYRRNSGQHGAEDGGYTAIQWAATYDEWGWFIRHLFSVDPAAIVGQYDGRDDFHKQTGGKYRRRPAAVLELERKRRRLEELRQVLRSESISYGELAELQGLADYIEPGDVELLEPAGVPEFPGAAS